MSGIKTLVRQSSHYLTGQVGAMLIGLISFPVLTRVLSVADYGTMDIIGRLALLGTAAGKLGVQHAVLRYFNPKLFATDTAEQRRFYSTGLLGAFFTATLAGAATIAAFLIATRQHSVPLALALAVGALTVIRSVYSILTNLLRAEERSGLFTALNTGIRAITVASILAAFSLSGPGLQVYFAVTVAIEALAVLALAGWFARRGMVAIGSFDRTLFSSMVAFGLPMVSFETLTVALDAADRFLILAFLGVESQGYYAAAFTICIYIQDLLMAPINLALMPLYLKLFNTEGAARTAEFLTDSFRLFVMAAACLMAGVTACASSAITLLASAKYARSAQFIPWIVAGLVLYAANAFLNAPLLIEKRTKTMATLVGAALVVKILLNLALLKPLGLYGAVISTVFGYLFLLSLTAYRSRKLLPIGVDSVLIAKCGFCAALSGAIGLQIHLSPPAAELTVRAASVLLMYVTALGILDAKTRQLIQKGVSLARGGRLTPQAESLGSTR